MNLWGREARSAKAVPPSSPHSPVPEETDPHPRNMAGMGIMPASFGRDEEGSTDGPDQAPPGVPFVSALLERVYTQFQCELGFRALEEMGVMPGLQQWPGYFYPCSSSHISPALASSSKSPLTVLLQF